MPALQACGVRPGDRLRVMRVGSRLLSFRRAPIAEAQSTKAWSAYGSERQRSFQKQRAAWPLRPEKVEHALVGEIERFY